jgi:ABC-type bacteriocin/lantibiotic exporter with double-glycine peptidase domain
MNKINKLFLVVFVVLVITVPALAAPYGLATVSDTAVQIYAATSTARALGVVMCNAKASTVTVYFASDSSVTSTNYGYSLEPGGCLILNGHLNSWWAVTAGTTATVSYQLLY